MFRIEAYMVVLDVIGRKQRLLVQDAARSMNGLHLYMSGDELQGDGPAEKGGLKSGDFIEVVDGA